MDSPVILAEAAAIIQKHCDDTNNCRKCIFFKEDIMSCALFENTPHDWDLDEPFNRAQVAADEILFEGRHLINKED